VATLVKFYVEFQGHHFDYFAIFYRNVGSNPTPSLGRIGDALEVILNHVKLDGLSQTEKDALSVLRGQLAAVRQVKQRARTSVIASA